MTATAPRNDAELIAFLPMVQRIARRLSRQLRGVGLDDLVAAGGLGLVQAFGRRPAGLNDVDLGRWVSSRIKGAMLDHARAMSPAHRQLRAARRAHQRVVDRLGAAASPATVAAALGMSSADYDQHQRFLCGEAVATHVAYDDERCSSGCRPVADQLAETHDLQHAWATLPEGLRAVMELHYVEGIENREIARRLGVHESRVSQLQRKAIEHLRAVANDGEAMAA